jgi:glutathione S-transferase
MKLRYSPSSPFVRKVVVAAMETGLDAAIERIPTNPMKREDRDGSPNPLGKVPCLETDDGLVLYDSPVIIEYLDSLHAGQKLIPVSGRTRWTALRRQALGDGIIENTVLAFIETLRKPERRSEAWIAHNKASAMRAAGSLEAEADDLPGPVDVGRLTLAVALDFVDMHNPDAGWRRAHPKLAAWFDAFKLRPSLQFTALQPWS